MKRSLLLFILLLILSVALIGCGKPEPNAERLQEIEKNILSYENVSPYIEDEITFNSGKNNKYEGLNIYFYTLQLTGTDKFNELDKDGKYYKVVDILKTILADNSDRLDCENKKTSCSIYYLTIQSDEDTYRIRYEQRSEDRNYEVVNVDTKERYKPQKVRDEISSSVDEYFEKKDKQNEDIDTTVDDKNGNDWLGLTENQKFHAVSNALFKLDQQGYTITESEDYYIDALNEFYSDSNTLSTSLSNALASIGTMSGTIIK